ncbi:hypothetical protein L9F63_020329 [Diploptera punctata]|uniref:Uncharacterized protein n=1 Tax=Diploptera punctata TaxID=6984 RepID=A0AAD8EDR3_DIPPU|nr:hypothetical protein L9F63_020329 [Diploptera punctata]
MISKLPREFHKFQRHCYYLRRILKDTQTCLDEINTAAIFPDEKLKSEVLTPAVLERLTSILECHPALIVLGQSHHAKATLVNAIFGELTLAPDVSPISWLRFTYKASEGRRIVSSDRHNISRQKNLYEERLYSILDVEINHPLLKNGFQLIVPPDNEGAATFQNVLSHVLPLFLYAIEEDKLQDKNIHELRELKQQFPELPVFFICTSASTQELTESEQHQLQCLHGGDIDNKLLGLIQQLATIGYLHLEAEERNMTTRPCCGQFSVVSDFLDGLHKLDQLEYFVRGCLKSQLVQVSNILNDIHSECLQRFILSAFDMAREIQITPRRIQYAQDKEADLYKSLMVIAGEKQKEMAQVIELMLQDMRDSLIQIATEYKYQGDNEEVKSPQAVLVATSEIQHLVLTKLSSAVALELVQSMACLQKTFVGTLQRCLESLEKNYDQEKNLSASDAVKQILSAAYNIKLTTSSTSSLLHSFLVRLRKIFHTFQFPWNGTRIDAEWKKRVATEMLDSLSAARLAKSISTQFREKIRSSHEAFLSALRSLENHYTGHLEKTEEQRIAIRKYYTLDLLALLWKVHPCVI